MKIVSWNVNGLRSVYNKGVFEPWLSQNNFDIINIQESKLQPDQLPMFLQVIPGYALHINSAEKKGYSGVITYTKVPSKNVEKKIGHFRFDNEGRMLKIEYDKFTLFNFYIPNGGSSKEAYEYKLQFYDFLLAELAPLSSQNVILVGDFNIAHNELDLAFPKKHANSVMFRPQERERLNRLVEMGYIDTFREQHKDGGNYSWWSYGRNAREDNIGWRIDYIFVSEPLRKRLTSTYIMREVTGSDHCPVVAELSLQI
jgi:exodeoxyribonuclease III